MEQLCTVLRPIWLRLALAALGAAFAGGPPAMAQESGGKVEQGEFETVDPSHTLVGSKIVGPGLSTLGAVEDLVVDQRTGEVAMLLVKANGWFGGYGVVPLNFVETKTEIEVDGEGSYLIGVRVNEATFDNIAKWNGEGSIGVYLRRYQSVLSTIYGLDQQKLEAALDLYALSSRSSAGEVAVNQE